MYLLYYAGMVLVGTAVVEVVYFESKFDKYKDADRASKILARDRDKILAEYAKAKVIGWFAFLVLVLFIQALLKVFFGG